MTNASHYPRLRVHIRRGKRGQVYRYWYYDRRVDGLPDVSLGSDYDAAVAEYKRLHHGAAPAKGTIGQALERFERDELPTYGVAKTRADYARHVRRLMKWCGHMKWSELKLPAMHEYLRASDAGTQANRMMSVLSIVWARARLWGLTELPWPAAGVKRWKNTEAPRRVPQLQAVFDAVYLEADQLLRDCMDLQTATGMRLTDCIEATTDGTYVYFMASKTGKAAFFDGRKSAVLQRLSAARKKGEPVLWADGPVTERKLNDRWKKARAIAAARAGGMLAKQIEATYLRDMRKLAADLAPSLKHAADLLQHQDEATTRRHYRSAASELTPVR